MAGVDVIVEQIAAMFRSFDLTCHFAPDRRNPVTPSFLPAINVCRHDKKQKTRDLFLSYKAEFPLVQLNSRKFDLIFKDTFSPEVTPYFLAEFIETPNKNVQLTLKFSLMHQWMLYELDPFKLELGLCKAKSSAVLGPELRLFKLRRKSSLPSITSVRESLICP